MHIRPFQHTLYVLVLSLLLLVPRIAMAQASGTIAGEVKDATGALLPGVTVESTALTSIESPAHCRIASSNSLRFTAIHGLTRGDHASLAPSRSSAS